MRTEFVARWRNPGDEERTNIPVLSTDPKEVSYATIGSDFIPGGKNSTSLWELYNYSNIRTAKGDFIRWQSLTLSWRCPQQFLKNIGVRSAVLRFQMQNLAVWTFDKKLKGQLLHSFRMEFPSMKGSLSYLSGKVFTAPLPEIFLRTLKEEKLEESYYENLE